MTVAPDTTRNGVSVLSRLHRFFSFVLFRIVPVLLIAGIAWSLYRVVDTFGQQYNAYNDITARQDAYAGTATAIAAGDESAALSYDDTLQLIAQFATNTPAVDDNPVPTAADANTNSGNGLLATNTPQIAATVPLPTMAASPVPPTEIIPTATLVPVQAGIGFVQPTIVPPQSPDLATIAGTAVPTQVPLIPRNYELVNILLLGTDDELVQDNTIRTDTMMVVSINTETGSVAMLNFPRDLFVYVPTPTMARINTVFGTGESFGWAGGGFNLLRQTIFYNFGINVHYYARINFTGFETIVNTLGGVEIAVDCEYTDFYPKEEIDLSLPLEDNYELRTLPVGYYTMDGFDALWYARTRKGTDDFERGRRQQELLKAILRKAIDTGQIQEVPNLWNDLMEVVETNMPFDLVVNLLPIALQLDASKIENFTFLLRFHTDPFTPSEGAYAGQNVQVQNYERIYNLLFDFYQPPTSSRLALSGSTVAVYNGTSNDGWDQVAAQRLRQEGLNAYAAGVAPEQNIASTMLVDYAGTDKGSPAPVILNAMNISQGDVRVEPDANRTVDYEVIVGSNYNSCPVNSLQ